MIAHHQRRWLYLGVPKTASTALHEFLPTLGGVEVREQHVVHVPEECREYFAFATALNPFRRAFALWRMLQRDTEKGAPWRGTVPPGTTEDFRLFVRRLLLEGDGEHPVYEWTVSRWLQKVNPAMQVEVIRAEELDAGLRRIGVLPPGSTVPVRNRTTRARWLGAYDSALEADVRLWAKVDFERFGYPDDLKWWQRRARRDQLRERVVQRFRKTRSWAERALRRAEG